MAVNFQSVRVTLKDFSRQDVLMVEINPDTPIAELKEELVRAVGDYLGLALDASRYKIEWTGTLAVREILLSIA